MLVLACIIAYLLGSIPSSVWIGRLFYQKDVRDFGSGNAGATNTFRVLGIKPGVAVLILDALKGVAAVKVSLLFARFAGDVEVMVLLGICAVIGHVFPVFAQFRGGKGIATLLGMIMAIHTPSALMAMATFAVVFLSVRIVSVSSILASLSFPIWLIFRYHENSNILIIFSFALVMMVLLTHQKNLERLLNREENRVRLLKKNRKT